MALNSNGRCDGCNGIVRNSTGRRMTITDLTIQHNKVCPGTPTPPTKGTTTMTTPDTLILTDDEAAEAEASTPLPVFVFGTLRPGAGNDRTWHGLAEPRHDGECWVDDHRLVSNGSFPYCLPSKGDRSIGCLIVPHPHLYAVAVRQMDMLEGVPHHYTRQTVAVTTPDGVVMAWYYIPENWMAYADYRRVVNNDWSQGTEPRTDDDDGFSRSGWWAR